VTTQLQLINIIIIIVLRQLYAGSETSLCFLIARLPKRGSKLVLRVAKKQFAKCAFHRGDRHYVARSFHQ